MALYVAFYTLTLKDWVGYKPEFQTKKGLPLATLFLLTAIINDIYWKNKRLIYDNAGYQRSVDDAQYWSFDGHPNNLLVAQTSWPSRLK